MVHKDEHRDVTTYKSEPGKEKEAIAAALRDISEPADKVSQPYRLTEGHIESIARSLSRLTGTHPPYAWQNLPASVLPWHEMRDSHRKSVFHAGISFENIPTAGVSTNVSINVLPGGSDGAFSVRVDTGAGRMKGDFLKRA